jgi:hypothetical protein
MSSLAQSIRTLYFGFRPVAGHMPECSRAGTDTWEATGFTHSGPDGEIRETTLRFACHECGVVAFESLDGPMPSLEFTHATEIGYGSRPERVAGLWLHPGPRVWHGDGRGPCAFYVTQGKDRPREPGDVAGLAGWHLGKRGGVRWSAGLGLTDHGTVKTAAGQEFTSRRAAVTWIAAQLAGESL